MQKDGRSGLDDAQLEAIGAALSRSVALIQGPPGTGKSYVGARIAKLLLAQPSASAAMGPLLVLCYTNHALDQFLASLLDAGVCGIVRVGARGADAAEGSGDPRLEARSIKRLRAHANAQLSSREELLKRLARLPDPHLALKQQQQQQARADEEDLAWDALDDAAEQRASAVAGVAGLVRESAKHVKTIREAQQLMDVNILRGAAPPPLWSGVVGMTTTGAARMQRVVAALRPRVVLVEEAGEIHEAHILASIPRLGAVVLVEEAGEIHEAHILASISPQTEQLILIGDHLQASPAPAVAVSELTGYCTASGKIF
ncbi:P-loop containing nucleoside triphosphate hydrolase protein [Baffinella frigidus]|nr:P-loop containing nucleoside triphosphate hydrolase protein [Cryptophyta sp. CCMP2293]